MSLKDMLQKKDNGSFRDIVLFEYSQADLDQDIKRLVGNGIYQPSYTAVARSFLEAEACNFLRYMPADAKIPLSISCLSEVCNDKMQPSSAKINQFLKNHHISDVDEQHTFRKNINKECFGSGFIHSYKTDDGNKKNIYLYDMVEDPFCTAYTFAHEVTHALQDAHNYGIYGFNKEKNYDRQVDPLADYREIHANLTAGTFLFVKALQTQNPEVINQTKERLLRYASSMSGSVKRGSLGVRYFDWRGLNTVLDDLPQKYQTLLTKEGEVNWKNLYQYTENTVKNMDYTPAKIEEFKKLLQPEWKDMPLNNDFLASVSQYRGKNGILDDLHEAARYAVSHPKTEKERLTQFYQMLANPTYREQRLFAGWTDKLPGIEQYRKLIRPRSGGNTAKTL